MKKIIALQEPIISVYSNIANTQGLLANPALRADTARRNSRSLPEEEPQCRGVRASSGSVR